MLVPPMLHILARLNPPGESLSHVTVFWRASTPKEPSKNAYTIILLPNL